MFTSFKASINNRVGSLSDSVGGFFSGSSKSKSKAGSSVGREMSAAAIDPNSANQIENLNADPYFEGLPEDLLEGFTDLTEKTPDLPDNLEDIEGILQILETDGDQAKNYVYHVEKWIDKDGNFQAEQLNRLFAIAIIKGYTEILRLVVTTCDYQPEETFSNCLHLAADHGQLACVSYLLEMVPATIKDANQNLPIHYAIIKHFGEIASLLWQADKKNLYQNEVFALLNDPLHKDFIFSFIIKNLPLKILIKQFNLKDKQFNSPEERQFLKSIHFNAVKYGRSDILGYLVEKEKIKLAKEDAVIAAQFGQLELLKWLKGRSDYSLLAVYSEYKYNYKRVYGVALEEAIKYGHFKVVKFLIETFLDSDHFILKLRENLELAIRYGRTDIVEFIFNYIEKLCDEKTRIELHSNEFYVLSAVKNNQKDTLDYLVEKEGYKLQGYYLLTAAGAGHADIVDYLLKHGINLNEEDALGNAAHHAAEAGSQKVLALLKQKGFDSFLVANQSKQKPLLLAIGGKYNKPKHDVLPTVQFLLEMEDNLDLTVPCHLNPSIRALRHNNLPVLKCMMPLATTELHIDKESIGYLSGLSIPLEEEVSLLKEDTLAYILPYITGSYEDLIHFFKLNKPKMNTLESKQSASLFCEKIIKARFNAGEDYQSLLDLYHEVNHQAARDFELRLFLSDPKYYEAAYHLCAQTLKDRHKTEDDHHWAKYHLAKGLLSGYFELIEADSPLNEDDPFLKNMIGNSTFKGYLEAFYILKDCEYDGARTLIEQINQDIPSGGVSISAWPSKALLFYQAYMIYKTPHHDNVHFIFIRDILDKIRKEPATPDLEKEKGKEKADNVHVLTDNSSALFERLMIEPGSIPNQLPRFNC